MPIYDRSIDSSGFQPITTATSAENYGLSNALIDAGLGIGLESLGMGLMGVPGMSGGRPLLGLFPGVIGPGVDIRAGMTTQRALANAMKANINVGSSLSHWTQKFTGKVHPSFVGYAAQEALEHRLSSSALETSLNSFHKVKNSPMGMLGLMTNKEFAGDKTIRSLGNRLGVGIGLKAAGSAWIFADMFSLGFSAASSAIQGIESFSYERRARIQSEGGLSADLGEGFADTRASFTQRQRAMQAIHNSQMNTRAAMGNEATFMHG